MERYEQQLAAAYVRGIAVSENNLTLPEVLRERPLDQLTPDELEQVIEAGNAASLKLYHFKKKDLLPRVKVVLGFLKGVQPGNLLDVGSGRGAFLFPFLTEFPEVDVTSVDLLPHRVDMLQSMARGGVKRLTALQQDICSWDVRPDSFDVVTMLEVLEHIPDVERAVRAAVKLAKRYVVVTVPSKPDNNPEHIHLLAKARLTELFSAAGCTRLQFGGVPGHLMLVASVAREE